MVNAPGDKIQGLFPEKFANESFITGATLKGNNFFLLEAREQSFFFSLKVVLIFYFFLGALKNNSVLVSPLYTAAVRLYKNDPSPFYTQRVHIRLTNREMGHSISYSQKFTDLYIERFGHVDFSNGAVKTA